MTEHFYTLDMGKIYGPKLECLAEMACFEDIEGFAALLLSGAIDRLEMQLHRESTAPPQEVRIGAKPRSATENDFDDGIPF